MTPLCPHHLAMRDVDRQLTAGPDGWHCRHCDFTMAYEAKPRIQLKHPLPPALMTGAELKEKLGLLGYSQSGFARFIEVQDRTVRRWIAGKDRVPKIVALWIEDRIGKIT